MPELLPKLLPRNLWYHIRIFVNLHFIQNMNFYPLSALILVKK
nr:MAG TPA: hypothetical protein [Caudoviricetes sp.]